jgi:hypothetical protein
MDRRQSLGLLGAAVTGLVWSRASYATTARAVSLPDLVARSTRVVRGTPLDNFSRSEDVGDTRHIVTYTRLRVDDLIQGGPSEPEILVRTLGGRIGKLGEIVYGEAELAMNEACLLFVQANPEGIDQVTAMAQGHYPIQSDASGTVRLRTSRNMPHLLDAPGSAVARLSGVQVEEARAMIIGAGR